MRIKNRRCFMFVNHYGSHKKQLGIASRQPLTNFVNLKSNTIMKKPHCKSTINTYIHTAIIAN